MAESADYDNQVMRNLRAQITAMENTALVPLPTPEVSRPVVWYRGGDENREIAAVVTQQLAPGQVTLMVFEPNTQPKTVTGVFFVKSPLHEDQKPAILKRCGLWNYCNGDKPTEKHKELHRSQLKDRISGLKESLRLEYEKEMRRQQASNPIGAPGKESGVLASAGA